MKETFYIRCALCGNLWGLEQAQKVYYCPKCTQYIIKETARLSIERKNKWVKQLK